jgi:chromosome segregation ATPase
MNDLHQLQTEIAKLKIENQQLSEQVASLRNQRRHLFDAINAYDPLPVFTPEQLERDMQFLTPINELREQLTDWIKEE